MSLKASPRSQQPLNSLATKLILFVFISTFATALVVSGISIQSTHTYLSQQIGQQYPAALARAGEAVLEWLVAGQEELASLASNSDLRRARRETPRAPRRWRRGSRASSAARSTSTPSPCSEATPASAG